MRIVDWPWQPNPRRPVPDIVGSLEAAVRFGLAVSVEELSHLTAMICSGIPPAIKCRAVWAEEGENGFSVTVDNEAVKYSQRFVRTNGGLAVDQDLFVLPEAARDRGYAKRLIRNLVIIYDNLGVRHISTYADHVNGAYTWARLGARALDPELQRTLLRARLAENADIWGIPKKYRKSIDDELSTAPDDELMLRAAHLTGEDGTRFGKVLLVGHQWDGYWDLHDPSLRLHLKETVG